jgi:GDP-D-mannose dehydratase
MNIILATRNSSKAKQIKAVFVGMPIFISTLSEAGISGKPVEDGETLRENALIKARYAFEHAPSGSGTMAGLDWKKYVESKDALKRPADVNYLRGDYSKAKNTLGWEPKTRFKGLVKKMVSTDIARWKKTY